MMSDPDEPPSPLPSPAHGLALPRSAAHLRLLIVEDSELDTELLLREFHKADFSPIYHRVDDQAALLEALKEKRSGIWRFVIFCCRDSTGWPP